MKKILFLISIGFILSCSGDDDANTDTEQSEPNNNWTVSITGICNTPMTAYYCVTPQVGNQTEQNWIQGDPCSIYSFTDIDGIERSGIINGVSHGTGGCQPME